MATTQPVTDWKKEWFEIEDAAYLNTAAFGPMPRVSLRAVQDSLEAKTFPHRVGDSAFFEVPNRLRASIARLIGSQPEEVALTTARGWMRLAWLRPVTRKERFLCLM